MEIINLFTEIGLKQLFCREKSKEICRDFLKAFLPEDIVIQSAACTAAHPYHGSTHYLFDFDCTDAEGKRLMVELVFCNACYSKLRAFYYARQMKQKAGENTERLHLILINRGESGGEQAVTKYRFYKEEEQKKLFFRQEVKIVHLREMAHYYGYGLSARAFEWCALLDLLGEGEVLPGFMKDVVFAQVVEAVKKENLSDEENRCLEEQSTDQEEFSAALQTARSAEAFRIAQLLIKEGIDCDTVKKCSGYSLETEAYRYGMPSLHSNCFLMEENEVAKVEVLCW